MSAAKTGTPAFEKPSASTCRVTVLPVPVAPVTRPCRLASLQEQVFGLRALADQDVAVLKHGCSLDSGSFGVRAAPLSTGEPRACRGRPRVSRRAGIKHLDVSDPLRRAGMTYALMSRAPQGDSFRMEELLARVTQKTGLDAATAPEGDRHHPRLPAKGRPARTRSASSSPRCRAPRTWWRSRATAGRAGSWAASWA